MIDEDSFRACDEYLLYPYEGSRFRHEKATGKIYKRFRGHPEKEIESTSAGWRAAVSTGRLITREEYFEELGPTEPVHELVVAPAASGKPSGKPVQELEAELRGLASRSRMPPSAVRRFFETNAALLADEAFLLHAIAAFRKPGLRLQPGEDFPAPDLTKIALAIPTKDGKAAGPGRRETLDALLQAYSQEPFKPEDRDFHRRLALAAFIRENAYDPEMLGRRMSCAFYLGDVYIDFPFEDAKFRYEQATEKVYMRFYGRPESEIESSSTLYHDAMSSGKLIAREEYFRDMDS